LLINLLADLLIADTGVIDLDTAAVVEKRGRGCPRGSKNKPKYVSMVALSSSAPMKQRPGRPLGSKNKPKSSTSLANRSVDANAACHNASPPPHVNVFSFFCYHWFSMPEHQRVPLKFSQFMDGRELREATLREESSGGTPYEVEEYYNGHGEMYFRGGWPLFAEDHDLNQGFFYALQLPLWHIKV
jgi:hypothetical protein